MARIQYDSETPGKHLQRSLLSYINHLIEELPCRPAEIFEVVVVGNPTMRDLFFGLNVEGIGQRPYRSQTEAAYRAGKSKTTSITKSARRLPITVNRRANVYGLPLISSHVGSDLAGCILATGLMDMEVDMAIMDIGTNTEVIVGNRERATAASCPAGPAFEGGGLSCGMPGLEGAVERVSLGGNGSVQWKVIGDCEAEGICGSGLVSLLGELLRTGRMNPLGRFRDRYERFEIDSKAKIYVDENDCSLLAQAKGANITGFRLVCQSHGLDFRDLNALYLAGGFARHLDISAARRIGLVPSLPAGKILQVGNAAIEGATIALLSLSERRRLEEFVKKIKHVELEEDPHFFDYFVEGCQFKPVEWSGLGPAKAKDRLGSSKRSGG